MRFIHTADWQIGMKAEGVGAAAEKVRAQRLETGKRVVDEANKFNADFLLVAGDLFEDNAVDRVLVRQVAEILAKFNGLVYIIPGNHDPFVPGSVWGHAAWTEQNNLRVITKPEPIEINGGWIYPCPLVQKHSMADPTAWIQPETGKGIRIGLAHGTVEGVRQDEPDYPIPRDTAMRSGLDYLALGHWHSRAVYPDANGTERMAYCGTHETSKFGERDSGHILKVEIEAVGAAPQIEAMPVGSLNWRVIEPNPLDFALLRQQLDELQLPQNMLLDIRLSGLLHASDQPELSRLHELAEAGRFLFARIDDSKLIPAPDDDAWLVGLPPGVVRDIAEQLRQFARADYVGERPEGTTPEGCGRALMELYRFVQECRS